MGRCPAMDRIHWQRPLLGVSSTDIRCNKNGGKNFAKGTTTIAAGSMTGFQANLAIFHYGYGQRSRNAGPSCVFPWRVQEY